MSYMEVDHVQYGLVEATFPDGDYTGDGRVDQADLDLVLSHWGFDTNDTVIEVGTDKRQVLASAWRNQRPDGVIGQAELDRVLTNWGQVAGPLRAVMPGAGQAVPEPTTLPLAVLALAGGFVARRLRPW